LAEARHQLEAQWGLKTCEIAWSSICDGQAFGLFALHLLGRTGQVHALYNAALREFRHRHRVRNPAQPMPDLGSGDGWSEMPFWLWTSNRPIRRPLRARLFGRRLEISDGQHRWELPHPDRDPSEALAVWQRHRHEGLKIRPRALLTTMFARLFLCDLFIHGIGGARYDQVTDRLVELLFACQAPRFLTLSATFYLPLRLPAVDKRQLDHLNRTLRDLRYHPEHYLDDHIREDDQVSPLIKEKRCWIARKLPRGKRLARHEAIERVNEALRERLSAKREEIVRRRDATADLLSRVSMWRSREWSFCLFPETYLPPRLLELTQRGQ
jgi:hypothetical protein